MIVGVNLQFAIVTHNIINTQSSLVMDSAVSKGNSYNKMLLLSNSLWSVGALMSRVELWSEIYKINDFNDDLAKTTNLMTFP